MGFSLTSSFALRASAHKSPAPEKCDPTAKNRVWGFFGEAPETSQQNRPQSLQPRRENRPTTTKVTSGRAYWPSRDPIGESGGINLYGMVGNDPVGRWDFLGLQWNNDIAVKLTEAMISGNTRIGSQSRNPDTGGDFPEPPTWPRHPKPGSGETAPDGTGAPFKMPSECTDCITSVVEVIAGTYEKGGEKSFAKKLRRIGSGNRLAKELIARGWKVVFYWNDYCNVKHSNEARAKSQKYYGDVLKNSGVYRGMNGIRAKAAGSITAISPWQGGTVSNVSIKFGYGVSTFESHTFLAVGSDIFEAHYKARTAKSLFSRKPFGDVIAGWQLGFYSGLMGAVLLPPDVPVPKEFKEDLEWFRAEKSKISIIK